MVERAPRRLGTTTARHRFSTPFLPTGGTVRFPANRRRQQQAALGPLPGEPRAVHDEREHDLSLWHNQFKVCRGDNWGTKRLNIDVQGEYHVTRNLSVFANLRNIGNAYDDFEIYGPSTPEHAQFRSRRDYGALWMFGVKGSY